MDLSFFLTQTCLLQINMILIFLHLVYLVLGATRYDKKRVLFYLVYHLGHIPHELLLLFFLPHPTRTFVVVFSTTWISCAGVVELFKNKTKKSHPTRKQNSTTCPFMLALFTCGRTLPFHLVELFVSSCTT